VSINHIGDEKVMSFICYEKTTGKIISFSQDSDASAEAYKSDTVEIMIVGDEVRNQMHLLYVVGGELISRPQHPCQIDKTTIAPDGSDAVTLSGVLQNSTITISNIDTDEEIGGQISGTDTFKTVIAGRYKLKLKCWPYLDREEIINAI